MTNAVTHAGVGHLAVALLGSPDEIRLEIVDAGIGFDVDAVLSTRGLGLVGIQERVRLLDGELVIQSRPGAGTSIRARVPMSGSDLSSRRLTRAQQAFFRVIQSRDIRLSSVVGLRPRRSAAPPAPRTRQFVLSSTARMWSASSAHNVMAACGTAAVRRAVATPRADGRSPQ